MIRYTVKTAAARRRLELLQAALTPERIDPIVDKVAFQTQAALIRATPKKWFGQVRRGWIVVKPAEGQRVVVNVNPIMTFLEEGTKAHGPVNADALFIPLTRRAVNATAGFFAVGLVPATTVSKTFVGPVPHVPGIQQKTTTIRKGKARVGVRNFIYGIDYVLAKRVKGIAAMHIAANQRPKTKALLLKAMKAYVREIIKPKK